MSKRRRMPLWRKLMLQVVPLVIASSTWWIMTGIGSTIDHHVQVSVHVR